MRRFAVHVLSAFLTATLAAATVRAQSASTLPPPPAPQGSPGYEGRMEAPTDELKDITVDEHLNTLIPLDLVFKDENGNDVALRSYFQGKKPVILQLGYYGCPMLCTLVSQGTVDVLKQVPLTAGTDYQVVCVSIDPTETPTLAKQKKQAYLAGYGRGGAEGWHFLTTDNPNDISALAEAVGFRYKWIQRVRQFSHPAVLAVLTPEGKISRYLYGVKFDPATVRLSLVEASDGKIGSTADRFILTCFQYDGKQGKYAFAAISLVRLSGILTVLILGFVIIRFVRNERRERAAPAGAPGGEDGRGS